jgi:branched-chain amino acid transport system substrate-binding protein
MNMRRYTRLLCALLVTIGALSLTTCKPSPEEAWQDWETIKIGVPTLITGYGAPMGADILAGISMAVERVNAEGGVLGKPLEMIITDIRESGAEDCRLAADFMAKSGVVALFPGAFYGPACIHEFGRLDQPLLHGSAIKETVDVVVANLPEYRNIFQVSASEESFGINAYQVLAQELPFDYPNRKIALLGGDISYDMLIKEGFRKLAEENGWEIIMDDTYPYGTTEFGAQLARIRAEEPAIIFGCMTSVDTSVAFVNQFLQNPTNSLIFIQWSPVAAEFKELLGEKANGVLWQTEYAYLPTPENLAWAEEFEARFGRAPGMAWPAMMEDMLYIWKAAVESCGSPVDYECIYEYLEKLSEHPYEGREGRYGMDPARHEGLTGADWIPIHFYQIQNGQDVLLYLGTRAVEGNRFQIPPWFRD